MTLYEVITEVDNLRPNAIDDGIKARWVMQKEVEYAELIGVDVPELLFPEDQDLLMPSPHDYSYVYYLCALVDTYNQDTALYNNDYALANAASDDAKSWWRRQYRPKFRGNWITRASGNSKLKADLAKRSGVPSITEQEIDTITESNPLEP